MRPQESPNYLVRSLNIRLPIIAVPFCTILILNVMFFFFVDHNPDKILIFFVTNAAIFISFITAYYAYVNANFTYLKMEIDRKQCAFQIASRWNSPAMENSRAVLRKCKEEITDLAPNQVLTKLAQSDVQLSTVFGFFEEVSIAINHELADEDVLYDQIHSALTGYEKIFRDWIDAKRVEQPSVLCETSALAVKWRAR